MREASNIILYAKYIPFVIEGKSAYNCNKISKEKITSCNHHVSKHPYENYIKMTFNKTKTRYHVLNKKNKETQYQNLFLSLIHKLAFTESTDEKIMQSDINEWLSNFISLYQTSNTFKIQ